MGAVGNSSKRNGSLEGRRRKKLWPSWVIRLYQVALPLTWRMAWLYRRTLLRRTRVVVVVGSFGKTTTTRAVAAALGPECVGRARGNARSFIAEALVRVPPFARWTVIEAGIDRPGQMGTLARMLRPDITVVTGIGSEHNRSLFNLGVTRYEKSKMLSALGPDGLAVLNGDDPNVLWMAQRTRARVKTYGFGAENDVRAVDFECHGLEGATLSLVGCGTMDRLRTRLPARQQALSLLAAFAIGREVGIPTEILIERLSRLEAVQGRFRPVSLPSGAVLIRDEFKGAFETIESALTALEEFPANRRVVVMGEVSEPVGGMGPVYRAVGFHIGRTADLAVFVGRHFHRYAAGVRKYEDPPVLIDAGPDLYNAVRILEENLRSGDAVLLKGRDTQKLHRIALALQGETVRCQVQLCRRSTLCDHCPKVDEDPA